jgi:hypothetical protein
VAVTSTWAIVLRRSAWGGFVLLILAYAGFAASAAGAEVLHLLGLVDDVPFRSAPIFFVVHALGGTAARVAGPPAVGKRAANASARSPPGGRTHLRRERNGLGDHRASHGADVRRASRRSRFLRDLAVLWIATTVTGLRRILAGDVANHRSWMTRSYALTLFFVTGPIGIAVAESGIWSYEVAYPLAITLAWVSNLAAAETWLRWRSAHEAVPFSWYLIGPPPRPWIPNRPRPRGARPPSELNHCRNDQDVSWTKKLSTTEASARYTRPPVPRPTEIGGLTS